MARYKITDPGGLIDKIRKNYTISNRAAAQALNKTGTYTTDESVKLIVQRVNLDAGYVKKHLGVSDRASPDNLRVIIRANERGTLLTRYPNMKSRRGISVSINKGSGFTELRGAFIIGGLRGSGASGIAMNNKRAAEFFALAAARGDSTLAKTAKLARLKDKALNKPRGVTVLSSRSINQLFSTVRDDVLPKAQDFLLEDFIDQFQRLKIR